MTGMFVFFVFLSSSMYFFCGVMNFLPSIVSSMVSWFPNVRLFFSMNLATFLMVFLYFGIVVLLSTIAPFSLIRFLPS